MWLYNITTTKGGLTEVKSCHACKIGVLVGSG